jgi:hypothetical protein
VYWLYNTNGEQTCNNQADVQFNASSAFVNYVIRNNSFDGGIGEYVAGASFSNVTIDSNAGSGPSQCFGGMTFRYNVWSVGSACASTDRKIGSLPFVSTVTGAEDLHLSGSGAVDAGNPVGPAKDIDGQSRPMGTAPDAGADEKS